MNRSTLLTCGSRAARRALLPGILAAVLAVPVWAAPPISVDVEIDRISSTLNGDFVYQTMAPDQQGDPKKGRLALDVFLVNNENFVVEVKSVTLHYASPNSSVVLEGDLRMRCGGTLLRQDLGEELEMPANTACRVGVLPDPVLPLPAPARLRLNVAFEVNDQAIWTALTSGEQDLVAYSNSTPWGSYRFPAKAEDLAAGTFWSGRSASASALHRFGGDWTEIYAYDMGVIRDDNGTWKSTYEPAEDEPDEDDENEDFLVWGKPVYAAADGVVADCQRGFADEDDVGSPNYLMIDHGDETMRLSHFRQNSIPPELCVVGAVVEVGDELGEVGASDTQDPHLHVEVRRDGLPMPLMFNDAFVIERDVAFADPPYGNAPWARMDKAGFSFEKTALWPSALRRRGDATEVEVEETSIVNTSTTRALTAVKDELGDLRVTLWETPNDGEATPLDADFGGAVDKVALVVPYLTSDGALAMVTGGGDLKIAGYDVDGSTLERQGNYTDTGALDVAATQGNFTRGIVTAVRTALGNLRVVAWKVDVDATPPAITKLGEDTGGATEEVAIAKTINFPGVITALRLPNDDLKLITWSVESNGASVEREDEYVDAKVQQVSIARLGTRSNGHDLVVTAVRTLGGDLELVSWSISAAGAITRLEDAQAGEIGEVDAARASSRHVLTAVNDDEGDYKLIAWHVADDGTFTRRAQSTAGEATGIRQTPVRSSSPPMAISAMIDGNGDHKLIVHEVLLTDD